MRKIRNLTILIVAILLMIGCEEESSPSVWDPDDAGAPNPVINSVDPPEEAYTSVSEITVNGDNFFDNPDSNFVYFDNNIADVISASENQLIVKSPDYSSDSITIKVAVHRSYLFAEYGPYSLLEVINEIGNVYGGKEISSIICDKNENVYVSAGKTIYVVKPDSIKSNEPYASLLTNSARSIKISENNYIYYIQGKGIFRIDPSGSSSDGWYSVFPSDVYDMDFNSAGNLFVCGENAIYYIDIDTKTVETVSTYEDYLLNSIKFHNGYIYVSGEYIGENSPDITTGIWKHVVEGDTTLSEKELVADWNDHFESNVLSLTFYNDMLFIGTDGENPLLKYDGASFIPYYEGVLKPNFNKMVVGNFDYLYVIRKRNEEFSTEDKVLRIKMVQ